MSNRCADAIKTGDFGGASRGNTSCEMTFIRGRVVRLIKYVRHVLDRNIYGGY